MRANFNNIALTRGRATPRTTWGRLFALLVGGVWLCAPGIAPGAGPGDPRLPDKQMGRPAVTDDDAIGGLPYAGRRVFRSLDEYLTYLREKGAPIDKPWYREIGPGAYVLQRGNMRRLNPPETFTRAELMRKFGFVR